MDAHRKKLTIQIQRHRKILNTLGYIGLLCLSCLLLWDPSYIDSVIPFLNEKPRDMRDVYTMTTKDPGPPTLSVPKTMGFDFMPKNFSCEKMFHQSGHGYQYPESYWDHVDSFKGALAMYDLIQEGVANEQSWIISEIGGLGFVRNVCETGFGAGHYTFHWLVSQDDSVVYSLGHSNTPMEVEMQDFMAMEFPDRFFGVPGDSAKAVENWVKQEVNKTTCDVIFISSQDSEETIRSNVRNFHKVANSFENVVIFDAHPRNSSAGGAVWTEMVAKGVIEEHFRCFIEMFDDSGTLTNQRGLLVGSYKQLHL